LTLFYRNCT